MPFNFQTIARCTVLFVAVFTSLATSQARFTVEGTYNVVSDCSDASAKTGVIGIFRASGNNSALGSEFAQFGFPDKILRKAGRFQGPIVSKGGDKECTAYTVDRDTDDLLFVCKSKVETCTIFLSR